MLELTYNDLVDKQGEFQLSIGAAKILSNIIEELNAQKKKNPFHKHTLKDLSSLVHQKYGIICNEATVVKEIPVFVPDYVNVKNEEVFKRCISEIKVYRFIFIFSMYYFVILIYMFIDSILNGIISVNLF